MMNAHDHGASLRTLPDNVVAFPRPLRARPAAFPSLSGAVELSRRRVRPAVLTAAELNARLLVLLGICTTGAAVLLMAIHILHG